MSLLLDNHYRFFKTDIIRALRVLSHVIQLVDMYVESFLKSSISRNEKGQLDGSKEIFFKYENHYFYIKI